MILLRRCLYITLGILGLAVSLGAVEALLRLTGIFELLGVRTHGFLIASLSIAGLSSLVTWFIARDVATGSLNIAECSDQALHAIVDRHYARFGLSRAPALGLYANSSPNAFAVGRTRGSSLLAVSEGLLHAEPQIAEVIVCQQLARIGRGDVATQTLLQGLTQVFTLFPTRVYALILGTALRTTEGETPTDWTEILFVRLLEVLLTPFTSLLARLYARQAEGAADYAIAAVLGARPVTQAFETLLSSASLQPYREIFIQPLCSLAPQTKHGALLHYHRSLQQRIAAIASAFRD